MISWILGIGKLILNGLLSWFKSNKAQEYKTEAESAKEALNSVGESLKIEDKIKKEQDNVDKEPEPEITSDDAFGDNDWNNK